MISNLCNWFWKLGLMGALGVVLQAPVLTISKQANAQVMPDSTLAGESSVVVPNVIIDNLPSERVDGGAIRGTNLFHSFQEFNIGEGRGVYFSNPSAVENIFSRVTGVNSSNILGRLGVLGNANLYLMNPNGIIFGQNASLDVEGSFFATTAEAISFGKQGYFSATQPQQSSLLSVSSGALFFNQAASQPGNIINKGNLSAPKDLTLAGGNLDLQGQFYAGGNLTLQATDKVKIRDSQANPFLARSGGNLAIVGNQGIDILALNHPTQTPFVSGGNLSLISDGVISGDARFSSGGNFSIHNLSGGLANFVSKYDPIISSNGDVDVAANYTGASLLVESKGNIRFGGDINITMPDTSALPAGQDTATLSNSTALIMRSGQNTLAYGGVNNGLVPAFTSGTMPEGITLGGDVSLQRYNEAGGLVSLTAASGNVSTKGITTNGGEINLKAENNSITTGILNSSSRSFSGSAENGGAIKLSALDSINTGSLFSASYSGSGNSGNGGAIILEAFNNINITDTWKAEPGAFVSGALNTSSLSANGTAKKGGEINLSATNGINIAGNSYAYSVSYNKNAGNGGDIRLEAKSSSITTGNLSTNSGSNSNSATSGNGGAIALTANGNITTGEMNSEAEATGNGGNITLTSNAGAIDTTSGTITSQIRDGSDGTGRGGTIVFTAKGDIQTALLNASAEKGDGGNIQLTSTSGAINTIKGVLATDSRNGSGGAISLKADNSNITTGILNSSSLSGSGSAGNGGAIELSALDSINTGSLFSAVYSGSSGNSGNGGAIILKANNINIADTWNAKPGAFVSGALNTSSLSADGTAKKGGEINLSETCSFWH